MTYYHVSITGIVAVGEGEPSPLTWTWSPEILGIRLRDDVEHIDIQFRQMTLAPSNQDFKDHLLREGLMTGTHDNNCRWPDASCLCQG